MKWKSSNVLGLSLMLTLVLPVPLAARSCDCEISALTAALNAIAADYASRLGKLSAPDIEVYARRSLPLSVGRDCVGEVERRFPVSVQRLVDGGLSFYSEADHFMFGFRVGDAGKSAAST
jgi:hypothetical protein